MALEHEPPKYLPEDVLRAILSKLPVKSLNQCRCVCKTWYRIIGLPNNILINILCRLPLKFIVRCRCVCKSWYHIIATTSFGKSHLNYQEAASNSNKYMLYETEGFCTLLTHSHSIYDGSLKYSALYNMHEIVRDTGNIYRFRPTIYGMCNGLLCLSDVNYNIGHTIYLWNPTCRKIKKLPQFNNSIKDAVGITHKTSLSFGYYNDDFKVIVTAPLGKAYIVGYIVWVYSLNSNSWNFVQKEVRHHIYVNSTIKYGDVKVTEFVDGTVYFLELETEHVRCFDLSNETIRLIPFPRKLSYHGRFNYITIEPYRESIAILGLDRRSRSLSMWILEDKLSFVSAGEMELDNIDRKCYLVGLLNNGKYLVSWVNDGQSKCYLCDLEFPGTREVRSVRGSPYIDGHIHPNYVESLLLLNEDQVPELRYFKFR